MENTHKNPTITYEVEWEGIAFTIRYTPQWLSFMAHIEVFAEEPLPITETGYRSIFLHQEEAEQGQGAIAIVEALLTRQSASLKWKQYQQNRKQLSLFS
jgi:hypothetical protein